MKKNVFAFVVIAFVLIGIGIFFSFMDISKLSIDIKNAEYVGAIFSLAGVFLFFAALLYQIEEYKLQVEELKKSVLAQTKSSEALDEQKNILLEQNSNSIIFGMIDSFNTYKEKNDIHKIIDVWYNKYQLFFVQKWKELSYKENLNHESFNSQFAFDVKVILNKSVIVHESYHTIKRYVQFVYNVLIMIEEYSNSKNIFRPFFLSQLNAKETAMLYLLNLADSNMPVYDNLPWHYGTTLEFIDMLKKSKNLPLDLKELDCKLLTEEFNKLRPNKIRL